MQRMSDMLTRWLDGNLRQNHSDDSTEMQPHPDQAGLRTALEPMEDQAGAQSVSSVETVSHSNENIESETQSGGQTVDGNNSEMMPVSMDVTEQGENNPRPQGVSAIETLPSSSKQLENDSSTELLKQQSFEEGPSSFKEDGTDYCQCSPDSNKDSSDTKSDESQASFVCKIASMEMDDLETVKEADMSAEDNSPRGSDRDREHSESLPYNPLFPTVYSGKTQESFIRTDMELKTDDNLCYKVSFNDSPKETVIDQSSELDRTESMACDVAKSSCDIESNNMVGVDAQDVNHDRTSHSRDNLSCSQAEGATAIQHSVTSESSIQTAYNASSISLAEEQTMIRQTMEAAVETLRERNLEPVISLHYSSEGTSNSTITLGFASFDHLHANSERHVENAALNSQSEVSLPIVGASANLESIDSVHSSERAVQQQTVVEKENIDQCVVNSSEVCVQKETDREDTFMVNKEPSCQDTTKPNLVIKESQKEESNDCETKSLANSIPESAETSNDRTEIPDENSIHMPGELTHNLEEKSNDKDSHVDSEDMDNEPNVTSDQMLHTGFVVTAVDNELSDHDPEPGISNSTEAVIQPKSTEDVSIRPQGDNGDESQSNLDDAQKFSIPDVAVTDSQNETGERSNDGEVEEDNETSEFERVLDQVLDTSDDSDSQINTGEREEGVPRHRRPLDVDQLLSQASE